MSPVHCREILLCVRPLERVVELLVVWCALLSLDIRDIDLSVRREIYGKLLCCNIIGILASA